MLGVTHLVFATFLYVVIWRIGLIPFDGLFLSFVGFGSLLPDIDHPHALIYQWGILPRWLGRSISETGILPHRRGMHTLWASIIAFIVAIPFFNVYLGFNFLTSPMLFLGYMSHLASDSLNKSGITWLRPLSDYKISSVITTGGKNERIFFYAVVILIIVLFVSA